MLDKNDEAKRFKICHNFGIGNPTFEKNFIETFHSAISTSMNLLFLQNMVTKYLLVPYVQQYNIT